MIVTTKTMIRSHFGSRLKFRLFHNILEVMPLLFAVECEEKSKILFGGIDFVMLEEDSSSVGGDSAKPQWCGGGVDICMFVGIGETSSSLLGLTLSGARAVI